MKTVGSSFSIFSLCLIRNEADIIRQCLLAASRWSEAIFVYDNGSDDGTWQTVLDIAASNRAVVPYRQDSRPFRDSLRGEIFEHYRERSREGDWWCRLDADEFYIDNPREFLTAIPSVCDVVWSASFQYYLTDKDAARYMGNPSTLDESIPVEQRCRYYRNNWSEPRFFRYHDWLTYRQTDWPRPLGPPHLSRIRLKHFQYRSPQQIKKRLATRQEAIERGMFRHEGLHDWKYHVERRARHPCEYRMTRSRPAWEERIVDSGALIYDPQNGTYEINEAALPPILPMP